MNKIKDQEIFNFIKPNEKLIPYRCRKEEFKKRGWVDYMLQRYDNNSLANSLDEKLIWKEIIYRFVHKIEEPPKCKTCGKTIIFHNNHYATFCSKHCSNTDPEVLAKNKAGVSRGLKKAYRERGKEIKSKRAKTLSERFGENVLLDSGSPFAVKQIQQTVKNVILKKYGVDNILKLKEYRKGELMRENEQKKWKQIWKERGLDIDYGPGEFYNFSKKNIKIYKK